MSEITLEQDEAMSREIDAHDEALKRAIENLDCAKCGITFKIEMLPRAIKFYCERCGWSAIYPIRTLGNSERAEQDEALDLIAKAERDVLKAAKEWSADLAGTILSSERKLANAVTLLESCEAMARTAHFAAPAPVPHYVLQSKHSAPGMFWNADNYAWVLREQATVYREDERERSLLAGQWIKIDNAELESANA